MTGLVVACLLLENFRGFEDCHASLEPTEPICYLANDGIDTRVRFESLSSCDGNIADDIY